LAKSVEQANFGLNSRNANKSQVKLAPFPPHARKLHFSLRYECVECRSKGYSIIVLLVLINIIDSPSSSHVRLLYRIAGGLNRFCTENRCLLDSQGRLTFQASLLFLQAAIERKMAPLLLLGWD